MYESNGCYVVSSNDTESILCACLHTTFFGLTWQEFEPEVNYIANESYLEISFVNLISYPLGWIIVLSWIFVCVLIIFIFRIKCLNL